MLFLLNKWKSRPYGPSNANTFIRLLESDHVSADDKVHILKAFNDWNVLVNVWFEVADVLPTIETFVDDIDFPDPIAAALVVSKVYFCLEQYEEALHFALLTVFNLDPVPQNGYGNDQEYVDKIVETAIDAYKASSSRNRNPPEALRDLMDRIVERNLEKGEVWHVLSLGFECHNLDMINQAINAIPDEMEIKWQIILMETVNRVVNGSFARQFRDNVIRIVIDAYLRSPNPDLAKLCECYIFTDNTIAAGEIITGLITRGHIARAYQIAFDLYEMASQEFIYETLSRIQDYDVIDEEQKEKVRAILMGDQAIKTRLDFYIRYNHTDMILLDHMKECTKSQMSLNATIIGHGLMQYGTTSDTFLRSNLNWVSNAVNWTKFNAIASLGLIHSGQEARAWRLLDPYLPSERIEGLGFKEGGAMLAYGLMYAKHGSVEALSALSYWLQISEREPMRHGACLGFGAAGVGSGSSIGYKDIREILQKDEAVSGEAAGIGLGLVMAGRLDNDMFDDLRQYTVDTDHDKIKRGIRTGLACAAYGLQKDVEQYMDVTLEVKGNPNLQSTGICMLSMAYAGTCNPDVVRRLLAKVASHPNDDVKRYATIGIGFVLSRDPMTCLAYMSMLIDHYNPHVRYGAAMAVAIASASTGNMEAISLVEPMTSDKESFVRGGSLMALAIIMGQNTDFTCPKIPTFRKMLFDKMMEKTESALVKSNAMIAQGLLDLGGQNASISVHNSETKADMVSMVGMMCFLHGWYWHTMYFFVSLAAKPSSLVFLNENFKMPHIEFTCHADYKRFTYPPPHEKKPVEVKKQTTAVTLSTTLKKKYKSGYNTSVIEGKWPLTSQMRKDLAEFIATTPSFNYHGKVEEMDDATLRLNAKTASVLRLIRCFDPAHSQGTSSGTSSGGTVSRSSSEESSKKKTIARKINRGNHTYRLRNPARVIPVQRFLMTLTDPNSYYAMKPLYKGGIIMAERIDKQKETKFIETVVKPADPSSRQPAIPIVYDDMLPHTAFEICINDY